MSHDRRRAYAPSSCPRSIPPSGRHIKRTSHGVPQAACEARFVLTNQEVTVRMNHVARTVAVDLASVRRSRRHSHPAPHAGTLTDHRPSRLLRSIVQAAFPTHTCTWSIAALTPRLQDPPVESCRVLRVSGTDRGRESVAAFVVERN